MVAIRHYLLILLALEKLPFSICYQHATSPRIENLTDTEVKYANIYWYYDPASRVVHANKTYINTASGPQINLDYRFVVPLPERLAGLAYVGHAARLRLVLERARNGQPLMVGALGGSITFGQAAGGWKGSYVKTFMEWLNAAMPPRRHTQGRAAQERDATATEASLQSGPAAAAPEAVAQRIMKGTLPVTSEALAAMKSGNRAASTGMAEGADSHAGDEVSEDPQRQAHRVIMEGFGAVAAVAGTADTGGGDASRHRKMQEALGASGQAGAATTSSAGGWAPSAAVGDLAAAGTTDGQAAGAVQDRVTASMSTEMPPRSEGAATAATLDATDATATDSTSAPTALGDGDTIFYSRHTGGWRGHRLRHHFLNGAVPGTQSAYMSSCLRYHLPPSVDIVFVEYAANDSPAPRWTFSDPSRRSMERLLRKLLQLPSKPAVVLVNMYAIGAAHGNHLSAAQAAQKR
ncbi:hypothetical protein Vretifemale_4073 [Volvox reticuliferus]|nr:hypothetical protein Vretifemale_4073 [Volvox reticuliferus]